MLGARVTHHQRHAGHAFVSDHAHFDAMIFGVHRHHRHHADLDEMNMGDGLTRHFDHLPFFQADLFEMRRKQRPILIAHLGDKLIAQGCARRDVCHEDCCGLR
jgi:hypothetical protein